MFHARAVPSSALGSVQQYKQVDMSPEQAVLQKQSLIATLDGGLQVYLYLEKPGSPPECVHVMDKPLYIPAMAGSVFALSDTDGVSGCFVLRGKEVRESAPSRRRAR